MTYKSGSNKLNCIEIFSFRVGISIYTGWLSAATILGASIMFSALGMNTENGYDEQTWGIIILWVGTAVYVCHTVIARNPVFGSVWIWALIAINSRQTNDAILENVVTILVSYSIFLTVVTAWLIILKINNSSVEPKNLRQKLTVNSHGILY